MKDKLKSTLAFWTCIITFSLGWILTIVNFFIPPIGEVTDSTLFILAQALLYTGAVVGITSYVQKEIDVIKRTIKA